MARPDGPAGGLAAARGAGLALGRKVGCTSRTRQGALLVVRALFLCYGVGRGRGPGGNTARRRCVGGG